MKNNKRFMKIETILILFTIVSFLIPLINAESIGEFKQGATIKISNYCRDGGCTGITLVSIKYPDGTIKLINQAMTMNGQTGYYNFSDTSQIGTYYFVTTGSNGITNTDSFNIVGGNLTFFIIVFVVFFGLTFYGLKIKNEWITLSGCFGLLILGVYTSFNGIGVYKNDLTKAISYITLMIGLGLGFETVREITYY